MIDDGFRERLRRRPPVIYVLLDAGIVDPAHWPVEARALADAGADAIQLRAKNLTLGPFVKAAREVLRAVEGRGIPVLINDRVDVAASAGASGVHLGAGDLVAEEARRILGEDCLVGLTAHSLGEVQVANLAPVDYIGFGSMFATRTRKGARIQGPEALTGVGQATTLPLLAIGGITPENAHLLQRSGVAGIAVAGGVTPTSARPGAVEALRRALTP